MRASTTTTFLAASAALMAIGTSAQGQIASLDSDSNYCFFLPPMAGGDIAANEDSAIAFCNQANPKAPGAKVFPDGFVLSAHWATGDGWVQITGQIDPTKYNLNPCDQGGQYDIRAPVGASCAGYSAFVNVIEPYDGVYGMRCCQNSADCNVRQSTYGVRVIFGAQYDYSGPRADGPLPASLTCVDGQPGNGTVSPSSGVVSPTASVSSPVTSVSGATTATATAAPTTSAPAAAASGSTTGSAPKATTTPSAGSTNRVIMATTALLATAVGLFFA